MRKIFIFIIFMSIHLQENAHSVNLEKLNNIKMEVFRNGKNIGFCNYKFIRNNNLLKVENKTKFEVKVLGIKAFSIDSTGTEIYENNNLIFFQSKTLQNKKKKFVNLKYLKAKNKFFIDGSSYKGQANINNIIGNWWNYKILNASSQISPLSGSVKKQFVEFLGKEKIDLFTKEIIAHKYRLGSKDSKLPENKKFNFLIWVDPNKKIILKVSYDKMGLWEYKLKSLN